MQTLDPLVQGVWFIHYTMIAPLSLSDKKNNNLNTVKLLSGHSKIDKTKVLKPCGSLMQVESIAECSPWSVLQYF